jgi:putative PIN family toxin of toxin-antitoxin system
VILAVFDTNTVVAGVPASHGTLRDLFDSWRAERFQLVLSEHILTEAAHAWTNPYWQRRFPADRVALVMQMLRREATITPITARVQGIAAHPTDDLILAAAMSAEANVVVTGDRQLRSIDMYQGIAIRTPREFLTFLEAGSEINP